MVQEEWNVFNIRVDACSVGVGYEREERSAFAAFKETRKCCTCRSVSLEKESKEEKEKKITSIGIKSTRCMEDSLKNKRV
jgi:hypothetical protein